MVPVRSEMMWTDPTLEGHAVVDEDNDDDGNELLDTEPEGLWEELYIEEEFDGTIEGEVLEEEVLEEHYGGNVDIDHEDDDDEDMNLEDEAWSDVIRRLSLVATLSRKEAVANSRSGIIGTSSTAPVI
ncbi:hypothetical protein BGZ76_004508 [Entomortierella beljakovae]|nr:hypothetical protein BGZ76_004508 [Entomortierella beljakovae]